MPEQSGRSAELEIYWMKLGCKFAQVDRVFDECMKEAKVLLSNKGIESYLENARLIGKMGRGAEPLLVYLEEAPGVAALVGEQALIDLRDFAHYMSTHTNFKAMVPFLQTSGAVAKRLHSYAVFKQYIELIRDMMDRTSTSVHGHHTTFASPGLPDLLKQAPRLLGALSLEGFRNWIEYGIKYYNTHPGRQEEYFRLKSADAIAVMQRERHGTLLVDNERNWIPISARCGTRPTTSFHIRSLSMICSSRCLTIMRMVFGCHASMMTVTACRASTAIEPHWRIWQHIGAGRNR